MKVFGFFQNKKCKIPSLKKKMRCACLFVKFEPFFDYHFNVFQKRHYCKPQLKFPNTPKNKSQFYVSQNLGVLLNQYHDRKNRREK